MPKKDIYHDTFKNALIKDGWTILADPYTVEYENDNLYAEEKQYFSLFLMIKKRRLYHG